MVAERGMNSVLYYPGFYPSTNWLRVAALCWDTVFSFRPIGRLQPSEIAEFDEQLGGLLSPTDIAEFSSQTEVLDNFESWISRNTKRLGAKQGLLESKLMMLDGLFSSFRDQEGSWQRFTEILTRYGVCSTKQLDIRGVPIGDFEPRLTYPEGVYQSSYEDDLRQAYWDSMALGDQRRADKIVRAIDKLHKKTFVKAVESESPVPIQYAKEVVFLPPEVPFHFLSLCANKAAVALAADLAAESHTYLATCLYSKERLTADIAPELLKAFIPSALESLPIEKLCELRNELSTSRLKYQRDVQAIVDEFSKLFSEDRLKVAKGRLLELAKERLEETQRAYTRSKIDGTLKTFGFAVAPPVLLSTLASLLGLGVFMPVAIASAVSALIAQRLVEVEKARAERHSAGFSYVLEVKRRVRRPFPRFW